MSGEEPIPPDIDLANMLRDTAAWEADGADLRVDSTANYCLVHSEGTFLHVCEQAELNVHCRQVANAIGVSSQSLQLIPAVPRIQDAMLQGVPCTAVIAVFEGPKRGGDHPTAVLLDLRPIARS